MNDAVASLDEIDRQRAALAARVRLPVWYRFLWAVALIAMFAVPLVDGVWSYDVVFVVVQVPAIVVLSLSSWVLHRASGARLVRHVTRAYPSARWPMWGMVAAIVLGAVLETALVLGGLLVLGLVVGVLAVAAAVICFDRHLAGIRFDIRQGRVVTA